MNKITLRYFLFISLFILLTGCGKKNEQSSSLIVPETATITDTAPAPTPEPTPIADTDSVPTPEPTPIVGACEFDLTKAQEVFDLINSVREENGLPALTWDDRLYESAKIRVQEITINWSHTRLDGSNFYTVSDALDGENIACGYYDSASVVDAWMDSPGHKENILLDRFTRTAVTYYLTADGKPFWCQHFGY